MKTKQDLEEIIAKLRGVSREIGGLKAPEYLEDFLDETDGHITDAIETLRDAISAIRQTE